MNAPKIKICGLTRAADIDAALALGVDYIGINLYPPSPRAVVDPHKVRELLSRIPQEKRVAVAVEPTPARLQELRDLGFHHLQVHFRPDHAEERMVAWRDAVGVDHLWLAPKLGTEINTFPTEWLDYANTWMIDTPAAGVFGGTGKVGDWDRFWRWRSSHPEKQWILAGGLSPENLAEAIREASPDILDFNSRIESAPGIKDPRRMKLIWEKLPP